MGFLSELMSEFKGSQSGDQQRQSGYPPQEQYGGYQQQQQGYPPQQQGYPPQQQSYPPQQSSGPPPVSPPWYAEWDGRENRWIFVNQQNGERTYNYPGPGFAQQQGSYGAPPPQGGYGYGQGGYSNQGAYNQGAYNPTRGSEPEEKKSGGNGWKYAAAGAAGLAGGALLMHESDKIGEEMDRAKEGIENAPENAAYWTGEQAGRAENFGNNVEQRWDNGVQNVEDFPENAARWTGEKVQEVEDFPEDAARWTGEKVQEVEDIPQDIENKWDNMVGGVERFGDNMDNAYDEGKEEQRYEDDDY